MVRAASCRVHFVLPNFPYTLNLTVDEKVKEMTLRALDATSILGSIIRTKSLKLLHALEAAQTT